MSFLGSVAGPLRKVLAAYAQEVEIPALLPCAGNFTVGAALRSGGYTGHITGCDITLYTSALGAYLAGTELVVSERPDCPEHLRGFLDCSDPAHLAASVAIMLDLRQVWKNKSVWHRRTLANFRRAWPALMEKTLRKLTTYRDHMAQGQGFAYLPMDAVELLAKHDKDHAVFIAPPTFGSRDYINQERMLAAAASWNAPEYTEISFQDVPIYEQITSFRQWMIIMERPLPEIEKVLGEPVAVVHKGRKSITYAYAGHSKRRIVTRSYLQSRSPGHIFPGDKRLTGTEKTGLVLLDKQQTVRMNELFMSVRVDYFLADVALSIGLCLDSKLIGKLDFNITKHDWALPTTGQQIYQRSDLAVPSAEPRLAKLVLMMCQSHEVKQLIDATFKGDYRYAVTTAFSRNPVSMKYRGVYKLHKRLEDKDGTYRLNYYGALGLWTLEEAYALWLQKHHN
ncbi:hypothetical protein [Oleidesulfovibrio sp.]|uniref:putative antirestriction adenine methyltransferase n=1 Tax=Oleidesulfovibrio sp. TaxID=2909707 RepID=UPI003A88F6E7